MRNKWSNKKTLLLQVQKLWDKGDILREIILRQQQTQSDLFPKRLVFKSPSSQDLINEFNAVRSWIAEINKPQGFRIVHKTIRHRVIGENRLPNEAWIDNLDEAVALLNRRPDILTFSRLTTYTLEQAPQLMSWITQHPIKMLTLAEVWPKLVTFALWRKQHAKPDIYLRQVSLPGIDSKFIEKNRLVLAQLLDLLLSHEEINHEKIGIKQFAQRYGFLNRPERIRFRHLDPAQADIQFADNDITVTARDFQIIFSDSRFTSKIKCVFITENEINFLSFPLQESSLVVFGAGYGFDALAEAGWLVDAEIFYWGDIDTHGFAILDQLRSKFSHVQSFLMDEKTLLDHREFWGQEDKPARKELRRLSTKEKKVYQGLINNTYGIRLRLEQERVRFSYLAHALGFSKAAL